MGVGVVGRARPSSARRSAMVMAAIVGLETRDCYRGPGAARCSRSTSVSARRDRPGLKCERRVIGKTDSTAEKVDHNGMPGETYAKLEGTGRLRRRGARGRERGC